MEWTIVGMLFVAYWLPTFIAIFRRKDNMIAISVLNFLLGWTLIGWVVACVWAFMVDEKAEVA